MINLNIKIELILEIWMINWIFYEYDSFFMNINYESKIWFEIDEYNSYSMNIDYDMRVWFMIWDDLYSINVNYDMKIR